VTARRYVVVGGGPAAAAAAAALSARGAAVLVVEPGLRLEDDREAKRRRLAMAPPEDWSPDDLEVFSYVKDRGAGLGQKRLFGSEFHYADPGQAPRAIGVGAHPSYAAGGLSNVWGAGLLAYGEADLADWPIGWEELAPHYAAAGALMPLSAEHDELAAGHPLFREPDGALVRSDEGERLLSRLRRHRKLGARGWTVGAARLAVRPGRPAPASGCVYCGRCLEGCPYGHIYSASQSIDSLASSGAIEYRPGVLVERLSEAGGEVRLGLRDAASGEPSELVAGRVYLAAGALSSTFILQRSGILPEAVELLDSQTLYLPLLWAGTPAPRRGDDRYALAQAFCLLDSPAVSPRTVHLSLYGYSADLPARVRDLRPGLARMLGPLLERGTRQLVFAIAFLHSDDSTRITSRLEGEGFVLEAGDRTRALAAVARLKKKLLHDFTPLGMLPLTPAAEIALPGAGYHYGSSVPMSAAPTSRESDLVGRPSGCERVHVVDAACFPTIPGGPITLSIMANAHRIATETAGS